MTRPLRLHLHRLIQIIEECAEPMRAVAGIYTYTESRVRISAAGAVIQATPVVLAMQTCTHKLSFTVADKPRRSRRFWARTCSTD